MMGPGLNYGKPTKLGCNYNSFIRNFVKIISTQ